MFYLKRNYSVQLENYKNEKLIKINLEKQEYK